MFYFTTHNFCAFSYSTTKQLKNKIRKRLVINYVRSDIFYNNWNYIFSLRIVLLGDVSKPIRSIRYYAYMDYWYIDVDIWYPRSI
jgi:hypothetical protein